MEMPIDQVEAVVLGSYRKVERISRRAIADLVVAIPMLDRVGTPKPFFVGLYPMRQMTLHLSVIT